MATTATKKYHLSAFSMLNYTEHFIQFPILILKTIQWCSCYYHHLTDKNLEAQSVFVMCPRWHGDKIRTQINLTPKHMLLTTLHTATHVPKSRSEVHLSLREWVKRHLPMPKWYTPDVGHLLWGLSSASPDSTWSFPCQSSPFLRGYCYHT